MPLAFVRKCMFDNILHILVDYMETVAMTFAPYAPGGTNGDRHSGKARREGGKSWPRLKRVVEFVSP